MMASQTCDVSKIQDEDVLRRMWQDTDDFSKKKEIRAHMYKVREQRLKEFYTTGEVARDIQTTSTISTSNTNSKRAENTHHADSLLDHSFQSLKSKEIRDSESPSKELTFSRTHQDRGWNVRESQECSTDGKTKSTSKVATTSGSKDIQGGVANYAALNEATASVYQDGDEKNFKKAVGTTNTSVLKQEAHGTEGNTSFQTSSKSSSTSSKYVSEQKSSQPAQTTITKTTQGYVPEVVLKDPNTRVYTETKTLPDGTRVTTTRYETTGSHTKQISGSTQTSSTTSQSSKIKSHEERISNNQQRQVIQDTQHLQQIDNQRHQADPKIQKSNVTEHVNTVNVNIRNVQNQAEVVKNMENVNVQEQRHVHETEKQNLNVQERHVHETEKHNLEQRNQDRRDSRTSEVQTTCVREDTLPKTEKKKTVTTTITKTVNGRPIETTETRRSSVQSEDRRDSINKVESNKVKVENVQHVQTSDNQKTVVTNYSTNVYDIKRVSVDISATHDAFVRSLRSVTPERERKALQRTPSPEKKYRKTSNQYGSNETITKSVHTSVRTSDYNRRDRTKSRSISPDDVRNSKARSPTSPSKKTPTRRPSDEPKTKPDKVLRRTDTYEERVRQLLGISEKKKPKPDKNVSDIITSDRNANRKPSLPDVGRRNSKSPEKKLKEYPAQKRKSIDQPDRKSSLKSPEKDIAPQTNWLPSAPRQTPERKSPERVTFSPGKAKEIRKYHGVGRTCSPAIDLQLVSDQLSSGRKSTSPISDDMIPRAFKTAKNGHIYTVDFIHVEKEISFQQRASPDRKSPARLSPDRASPARLSPERSSPARSSPQRDTTLRKSPEVDLSKINVNIEEASFDTQDELLRATSVHTTKAQKAAEDELIEQTTKFIKGKQVEVDEPLFTKKFMYKLGEDEEPESPGKSTSPRRTIEDEIIVDEIQQKSVKKDLSRSELKAEKKKKKQVDDSTASTIITTTTTATTNKTPMKKKSSLNDIQIDESTVNNEEQKRTTVTATINLESASSAHVELTPSTQNKPKNSGNKISRPKQRLPDVKETPKCISTKSIIINEAVAEQREIIVDLKRSKSSREDSPEKVWPVQTEEDSGIPRYPDQIQEPEDARRVRKLQKVNDIVIDENERVEEFNRITELIDTEITDVDRVTETDECLLTVNEKVNKFQHTKPNATKKPKGPAPKVSRPDFTVDETLRSDDCLLSVSDKVHKFKTTADQLKTETQPERPKSPRCQNNQDTKDTKDTKVTTTTVTSETVTTQETHKVQPLVDDECLLSVSEKVIKFVDTAASLKKKPMDAPTKPKTKSPSSTVQAPDETPKSSRKLYLSSVGKLRSNDNIKKAREIFETARVDNSRQKTTRRVDSKDVKLEDIGIDSTKRRIETANLDSVRRSLTYEDDPNVPGYMRQLDRSLRITSPHRESVMELEEISKGHIIHEDKNTNKFGVVLRRTDSGTKSASTERKEVSTIEVNGVKKEVEEVFELEILETMLENITSYELRRRIRAQIKIVKKMISEKRTYVSESTKRRTSPEKVPTTVPSRKPTGGDTAAPHRGSNRQSPDKVGFKPFRRTPDRQLDSKVKKDDRPVWAKEQVLRKASERVVPTTKKVTTTTVRKETVRKDRTSPTKDATDAITSCYGIGPTDENGMPLFGLKALRAANKTKVQGQVTKSTYYSENGQAPVGEIIVTKYSTDAKDLGAGTVQAHAGGILSKTTTQRIGKKLITDKKSDERTSKVTRRNSVKEITQKFIDNNIESTNSERKNSYKAGLILRTSSFKERKSSSRESTPDNTKKTGSFLSNTSKVTGLQDVITRMKTEEQMEGDSREDVEARQMLNKFLGSQVILSGLEGVAGGSRTTTTSQKRNVAMSTSAASMTVGNKRTTKVTTTVTENGVPKTNTRTFTHPITQDALDTVWNEQTLRLLLDQSTEYEERRIIRARLKQVMAEKEACSEFMEKTLEDSQAGNVHGESLLLPLLQNALEPPEFEQTADSGTESGEDLRSGLILEVQSALEKLSACLCSDSSDISQERRNSLLQLVSKLQTNLVPAAVVPPEGDAAGLQDRRSSGGGGRFARRQQRQRQGRHTVGVTSEELEDARRLMEEFVMSSSHENVPAIEDKLDERPAFGPVKVIQGVKNAMPKPFTNSGNTSGTSSTVQTPSNESIELERAPEYVVPALEVDLNPERYCYKQSVSFDQDLEKKPKLFGQYSLDNHNADIISVVQQAASLKSKPEMQESETDEETLRNDLVISNPQPVSPIRQPNDIKDGDTVVLYDQGIYPPPNEKAVVYEEPIILQTNPIYAQDNERSNRFNAKKSRMKRANTIDIPKPASYYYDDHESDGDLTEPETSRRSNYLALRGPIRVGNKTNATTKVPSFEPKTESDKKFLAFINRQNANANSGVSNKISLWDKAGQSQNKEPPATGGTNWTRKFGNIKTNFERVSSVSQPNIAESQQRNSARNFWKSAESQKAVKHTTNLRQRFETEAGQQNKHVVAGSLKVEPPHKNYKFVPQPLPVVNKFIHNPHESAFKPIHKTPKPDVIAHIKTNGSESSTPEAPMYIYSPKSFEMQSPVYNSVPWGNKNIATPHVNGAGERRVLSLAASKFEVAHNYSQPQEDSKFVPRKLSKEKIVVPSSLLQTSKSEKLVAYVPPVTKAGGVRKLSGQYDSNDNTRGEYVAQANVKYKSAFAPVPQTRNSNFLSSTIQNQDQVLPKQFQNSNDNDHSHNYNLLPSSPENYEKYHAHTSANDNHHYATDNIPPSFHTTSPLVQNIQMRHGQHADTQVYYNNVHKAAEHSPIVKHDFNDTVYEPPRQAPSMTPMKPTNHSHTEPYHVAQDHNVNNYIHDITLDQVETEPHVYYNNVTYQPPVLPQQTAQAPQRPMYKSQTSTESLHEYVAVSSKVMSGPVTQQAVTVTNKPKSRDEHDMDAALNLRNTLQAKSEIKAKSPTFTPKFCVNDEPMSFDAIEEESVVTGKFQIPAQISSPVLHQPQPHQQHAEKYHQQQYQHHQQPHQHHHQQSHQHHYQQHQQQSQHQHQTQQQQQQQQFTHLKPYVAQQRLSPQLSKSDSWHQVVQKEQVARKPSPRASPNSRTVVKSKSTHALGMPKQFEAGMSKDEMLLKKRTMEAYFGQQTAAKDMQFQPQGNHHQLHMQQHQARGAISAKRSVNRVKTTQKISTSTTEKIVTTKSFAEGPMTRTQVTTKVTQQQISKKPMSPFAKFRQMDRQNSLNTPPSTPKTPTSGCPMFKFTDPNMTQSTIKERLLHWCQMKTKEYDNIKLSNFSTCWADGLAFCALVHHFLPDAFDYSKLTPNNRRYNFTLAFQVADEKADIAPLLDVDDMVATRRPDWKCVFTYVQSIYRRFKDED